MRITAVIAECNPFHSGHAHLFKTIKEKHKSDAIMVILSGDFVQRGEPAVIDKFARTRMVLEGGADLVLELPVRFALSSAEGFARAGVAAMLNSGVATELSFGMETDYSKTHFIRLCEYLSEEPNEFKELLRKLLKTGISYPAARQQALKQCLPDFDESIINTPNNILAIE